MTLTHSLKSSSTLTAFLLLSILSVIAQERPKPSLSFCGLYAEKKSFLSKMYAGQYSFLRVNDGDTIVDIGSSSGGFAGAFSAVMDVKDLTFLLVDIDSACLNATRVENMKAHYSKVKGAQLNSRFIIVNNRPDSLWLPASRFSKAWLINTLHEIPDKKGMVMQIATILKTGGEVVVLEWLRQQANEKHGGCNLPLMNDEEIKQLFTENGFTTVDRYDEKPSKRKHIALLRFRRN